MVDTGVESPAARAQMVAAMSPEFNVMGTVNITGNSRNKTEDPFANKEPENYRALVHIFLAGGMDSFNLLVPQGCDLWTQYNEIRGDIALASHDLLVVGADPAKQPCSSFGIHHKLPFFQTLYEDGDLAFITNVGNLVEPITKQQYKRGGAQKCVGLFSHSDQQ